MRHSTTVLDIASNVVPLKSVYKETSNESNLNSQDTVSINFAFLTILFILQFVCTQLLKVSSMIGSMLKANNWKNSCWQKEIMILWNFVY